MISSHKSPITRAHFEEAKRVAYSLLDNLDNSLIYHWKEHTTLSVVPASLAIAKAEGLSLEDTLLVGIASAFHDTGFVKQYNANEPIGAQFTEEYMKSSSYTYTEHHLRHVQSAIENTNMKSPPKTKYEKVLRDADLAIIGHSDFLQRQFDLREEYKLHSESPMHEVALDKDKWASSQLKFVSQFHNWFTNGAKSLYEETKQKNIILLKNYYGL